MCCNSKICYKIRVIKFKYYCNSIYSQLLPNLKTQFSQKEEVDSYDNIALNQRFVLHFLLLQFVNRCLLFSPKALGENLKYGHKLICSDSHVCFMSPAQFVLPPSALPSSRARPIKTNPFTHRPCSISHVVYIVNVLVRKYM